MTGCTICGRPVYIKRRVRKKSSRAARNGRACSLKDHDLCQQCFERAGDGERAAELAYALEIETAWEQYERENDYQPDPGQDQFFGRRDGLSVLES